MALNPRSPIDTGRAAAFRPSLKIAARSTSDVRVRRDEGYRHDYQWRRTLDAVKESVAGAIDTFVTSASAEANAVAEETLAQATIEKVELLAEITRQQLVIQSMQADLIAARDKLQCMREQLATEVAARLRSESERDLAQQQLGDVFTERSTLMAATPSVQQPLCVETAGDVEIEDAVPAMACSELSGAAAPSVANQDSIADAHPAVAADIKHVLEQVKAIYDLDVDSNLSPAELIDSLTIRLRQARDVVVARSSIGEREAIALFDQQIDDMLFASAGTFGRHLSISAYALGEPVTST
jgi:hypothetical protein